MHLAHPFYRFPFRFDAGRLRHEIDALPESAWSRHPADFKGNSGLPLVSSGGGVNDDYRAPLLPTQRLGELPYVRQVMAQFDTVIGRSRILRLDAEAGVPPHVDGHYYWRTHTRVHIPVTTNPAVEFHCGDRFVNMAEGEAWTFDNWVLHKVVNDTPTRRIHLVFDTIGSSAFWKLATPHGTPVEPRLIPFRPDFEPQLRFETRPADVVMPPGEVDLTLGDFAADIGAFEANPADAVATLQTLLLDLRHDWRALWYAAELNAETMGKFLLLSIAAREKLKRLPELRFASNRFPANAILIGMLGVMASPPAAAHAPAAPLGS